MVLLLLLSYFFFFFFTLWLCPGFIALTKLATAINKRRKQSFETSSVWVSPFLCLVHIFHRLLILAKYGGELHLFRGNETLQLSPSATLHQRSAKFCTLGSVFGLSFCFLG